MTPLLSFVIRGNMLGPASTAALAADLSYREAHRWFFGQWLRADDASARRFHDGVARGAGGAGQRHKPFTVSSLQHDADGEWLRITSLDPGLTRWLLSLRAGWLQPLHLDSLRFCPGSILTNAAEHPWARMDTARQIVARAAEAARQRRALHMTFASPTSFESQTGEVCRLVFRSLAEKWNQHIGSPVVHVALVDALAECEAYEEERLQPQTVGMSWRRDSKPIEIQGHLGSLVIAPPHHAPAQVWHAMHTLGAFAFYAGVGRKTTMGMGRVRPEAITSRPPALAAPASAPGVALSAEA